MNAQLGKFGLNAGTASRGVGLPHLPYQRDEVAVEGGSSIAGARFPTPEEAKAKAMPSDDGLGLEEEQGLWPLWPESPQAHPQESVGGAEFRFVRLSFEDCQLTSERRVFQHEPGLGLKAGEQRTQKSQNDIEHSGVNFGGLCRNIKVFKGARGFRYPQGLWNGSIRMWGNSQVRFQGEARERVPLHLNRLPSTWPTLVRRRLKFHRLRSTKKCVRRTNCCSWISPELNHPCRKRGHKEMLNECPHFIQCNRSVMRLIPAGQPDDPGAGKSLPRGKAFCLFLLQVPSG